MHNVIMFIFPRYIKKLCKLPKVEKVIGIFCSEKSRLKQKILEDSFENRYNISLNTKSIPNSFEINS